ncbi:Cullin repeat-like-containing domain protein [Dipodascopsis uninucleata]
MSRIGIFKAVPGQEKIHNGKASSLEVALGSADQLSQRIISSLGRISGASTVIQDAIKPISGTTQTYASIAKNVDATVTELEGLRTYHSVFEEEEPRIKRGNLEVAEYFQSITRLKEAIKSLEGSTLRSSQQVTLKMNQLIITAVANVRDLYRKLLESVSKSPINADSKFSPVIPEDALKKLSVMIDFFMTTDMSAAIPLYADIRGKYIALNLSKLAEAVMRSDISRVKGLYRKGSSSFAPYVESIMQVIVTEDTNIKAIFKTSQDIQSATSATLKDLEKSFQVTVNSLNVMIRKNLIADCFYAFDILEQIHKISGELLLSTETRIFNMEAASKDLRKTAQESFPEMLRHLESSVSALPQLPPDFTVIEPTDFLTNWILQLVEYDTILAPLLIQLGPPFTWSLKLQYPSTFSSSATAKDTPRTSYMGSELLAQFIAECFDDLLVNIEIKARAQYKKLTRVGLQVVANMLYIERGLKESSQVTSVMSAGNGFDRLDKIRKRALNMFLEGWKVCASYLMDVTIVRSNSTANKTTMSSKDREVIKEKFRNFNTDFEELVLKFKEYNFTNKELREYLAKEVAFISPLYHRFYDRHKSGEFSKHTEKYIKYTKAQLDQVLSSLAD